MGSTSSPHPESGAGGDPESKEQRQAQPGQPPEGRKASAAKRRAASKRPQVKRIALQPPAGPLPDPDRYSDEQPDPLDSMLERTRRGEEIAAPGGKARERRPGPLRRRVARPRSSRPAWPTTPPSELINWREDAPKLAGGRTAADDVLTDRVRRLPLEGGARRLKGSYLLDASQLGALVPVDGCPTIDGARGSRRRFPAETPCAAASLSASRGDHVTIPSVRSTNRGNAGTCPTAASRSHPRN
ncbi:hypothetical protein DC74_4315 [Streptomyces noursei]|nr:hypothetical protein DC74_4315 [Streptomyces noursei]